MNKFKLFLLLFIAGALGGLANSLVVWSLGAFGITPALGFSMAPDFTFEWLFRRMFASGWWGLIFLIPVYQLNPIKKGALLSILPWLSSVLFVFPVKMGMGYFGLGFGVGTPIWTLFFAGIWGVTCSLILSKFVFLKHS